MKIQHSFVTSIVIVTFVIISLFTLPGQAQAVDTGNRQITDAVTQTNVNILSEDFAQSMGLVYDTMAHSKAFTMQNAVTTQNEIKPVNQAVLETVSGQIMSLQRLTSQKMQLVHSMQ